MQTPINTFKQAMREKRPQIGLWLGLADAYTAEICAGAGFDWLLLDGEHAPNDLTGLLAQLQAVSCYPGVHAVARVPMGHGHVGQMLIKQYLDLGAQTLLVPMVDTAEQAATIVRSTRYPVTGAGSDAAAGGGVRGMAGARASRWGRYPAYVREANEQVCVLVQVETREALDNIDAIAAVDGVDGVFIGPADLSASMGHPGNPGHPDVLAAIEDAIVRIARAGKAPGILMRDEALVKRYLELGALFVAVDTDSGLLARGTSALAAQYKGQRAAAGSDRGSVY
jgi:4-hydroxy-2-oxoheptanedioate aldolase